MRAVPIVSIPEDSHRRPGFGTAFFYRHVGEEYLVTARHNIKHHSTVVYSSQVDGFGDKIWSGHDSKAIYVLSPGALPFDVDGASARSVVQKIELDSDDGYHDPEWDVAAIELAEFRPENHGFDVFSGVESPADGERVSTTGADVEGGDTVTGMKTISGIVRDEAEYFQLGSTQRFIDDTTSRITSGLSGSPVYADGLAGVLTSYNSTVGKERAEKEVYYANFFPSTTILDLLP